MWALSLSGIVWRINPAEGSAARFATLGEGFGRSPIRIRNLVGAEGSRSGTHLLAASPREVKSVNLANGRSFSWIAASPGGRLLSDLNEDGYVTVESDGAYIYALEKRAAGYYLLRRHLDREAVDEFPAGGQPAGGPLRVEGDAQAGAGVDRPGDQPAGGSLRVEGRICAYTEDSLLALGDSGVARLPYAVEGPALLSPREPHSYLVAPGASPWLTFGSDVYLPAQGSVFLYMSLKDFPKDSARLPVTEHSAVSRDSAGRFVLTTPTSGAASGAIELFKGPAPATRVKDQQLRATGAEFLDGPFAAAFVSSVGAGRIRFYYEGCAPRDARLAGNIENQIGFYPCGAAFVLAHFGDKSLGFSIWDV
ncbi:MAG: hypothetical protein ABSF25_16345 [Bryobacteraceae bacterium]|jgi:hypothetical protein